MEELLQIFQANGNQKNKDPFDDDERGEWKSCLKTKKMKIMASGPNHFMANRWETMQTVTDFIFLGSKITADGDCRREIKRCFSLEEKLWQT